MCVHIICLAKWTPFGKELLNQLTICSLNILTIRNPVWFWGQNLVMIALVPGHCILVNFSVFYSISILFTLNI